MRRLALFSTLSVFVALSACSSSPKVTTDSAPGANFSKYKTFSFISQMPAGANPVAVERIQQNIGGALAGKGYAKGEPGDLTIVTTVGAQDKTQINTWGYWGMRADVYQYTEGKLSVDVFDTKTRQALWHGQATENIDPNKPDPAAVNAAVASVMASFPTRG
jgi:hypothetical protein